MTDCVFCQIVAGDAPGSIVHRAERSLALMTIGPVNPGHLMVIPLRHAADLAELDEETGGHLMRVAMRMAAALRRSGVRCEGINLVLADGEAAFQEVFHVHLHVFPRYAGDAFRLDADWTRQPTRAELDEIAGRVRLALAEPTGDGGP